jgi:hypothetical protein
MAPDHVKLRAEAPVACAVIHEAAHEAVLKHSSKGPSPMEVNV